MGAFEMMKTFDGYKAGTIPAFAFTSTIPFGFEQPDRYEAWFYERGGLEMAPRGAYAQAGMHDIAPTVYGQEPIHSKFPLHSLDDMAGKKGRFAGLASAGDERLRCLRDPDWRPRIGLPGAGEGRNGFRRSWRPALTANLEAGLDEVAKYVIVPGFHQPTTATSYVANQSAHDELRTAQGGAGGGGTGDLGGATPAYPRPGRHRPARVRGAGLRDHPPGSGNRQERPSHGDGGLARDRRRRRARRAHP
ncbi:MAG: hypothetical protein U5L11_07015 [Arhodomonas sp.]|nr:hypothetical protein [Arhodomonas sp.]